MRSSGERGGLLTESALSTRDRVLALLGQEPGLHLRAVPPRLGVSLRTVRHHVEALEDEGLLVPYRNGRLVCWFPAESVSVEDRGLVSSLRVAGQRAVLRVLLRTGPARFSELEAATGLPPRSLSRSLHRLTEMGIVEVNADRRYRVRDPDRVAQQLDRLRLRFSDSMAEAAREIFDHI